MKLNKVNKIDAYWTNDVKMIVDGIHRSVKFFIDVIDTFGEGTELTTPEEKFKNPELFNWVRPPFKDVYIELFAPKAWRDAKMAIGFYINYDKDYDIFKAVPVIIQNRLLMVTNHTHVVGCGGPLTVEAVSKPESTGFVSNMFAKRNLRKASICDGRIASFKHNNENLTSLVDDTDFTRFFLELLDSLLYINAKGVGTTTHIPPRSLSKKKKKVGSRLFEFKTLRIKKKKEPDNVINKVWAKRNEFHTERREHFVRGHMAVYTKEKPLFGNPKLVGPIWVPPHVRNKGTKGKVIKDYEVI